LPFKGGASGTGDDGVFTVTNLGTQSEGALAAPRSGVFGKAPPGELTAGVRGVSYETTAGGVVGYNHANGIAVGGRGIGGPGAVGIYGRSEDGFAGFFKGKVTIQGKLLVDELFAKSGLVAGMSKLFKIDHPLEPATKYLVHASVESSERKNMYDGIVTLDRVGAAWIALPDWFEALNTAFRYQLTCIGGYAPVYVASEIRNNRFQVAGGKPGMKVSWLVTGVRHDALAKANPLKVEQEKAVAERGKYLNPVELGFPESLAIHSKDDVARPSFEDESSESRKTSTRTPPKSNAARSPR
jgi:hypothetical protein